MPLKTEAFAEHSRDSPQVAVHYQKSSDRRSLRRRSTTQLRWKQDMLKQETQTLPLFHSSQIEAAYEAVFEFC